MVKAIREAFQSMVREAIHYRCDLRAARTLRRGFGQLSEEELDRSLADVAMNRSDLDHVFHSGAARRRLMALFKADPGRIPPRYWAAMKEAERVCAYCKSAKRCRRWFDLGRHHAAARVFCPNAALFESMARDARSGP